MKIIFAGSPAFALPTFQALLDSHHEILAVYTQPDKPAGRGRKLTPTLIKSAAESAGIPVHEPLHFKDTSTITTLADYQPDLMVVVAYGCLLPQAVLDIPRHGCINLHPSLLPLWRGATPIQCALLHGETVTGVTVIQMEKGMDSGPILFQSTHDIPNEATSESLHEDLATHGAQAIIDTIHTITTGDCQGIQQIDTQATYCKKIHKQDAVIDWQRSAHDIHCQVRAYNPWPVASTTFNDTSLRIWKTSVISSDDQAIPGQLIAISKTTLDVQTGQGALRLHTVQQPGKKALPTQAFIQSNQNSLTPFQTQFGDKRC